MLPNIVHLSVYYNTGLMNLKPTVSDNMVIAVVFCHATRKQNNGKKCDDIFIFKTYVTKDIRFVPSDDEIHF